MQSVIFFFSFSFHVFCFVVIYSGLQEMETLRTHCIVSKTCHTLGLSEGDKRIGLFFFSFLLHLYFCIIP